ncbi:polyprenyl synthetase family protein [Salirhabdus salicampi]|uniref:polyprenyl synthetase family protein n=1 Tax=Salirhabdus salicampi TaxID=476102 RepID=UPI0020C21E17|nr:farnesyl diphosphate synthase [Salirhabdus salicampi]MCP8616813.1 polyprenyl synthetase family protein [Salirhabdus salicampi]
MILSSYIRDKQKWINDELTKAVQQLQIPERLKQSMAYSIDAGGKRVRPILMVATFEAFQKDDTQKLIHPAVALEMIHTYSLIHDDLPAMDDDDYRRGKLTNHKQFDEATAVLAGDGLLTAAFQVISSSSHLIAEEKVYVMGELSKAAGPEGMVAGQMLDLQAEKQKLTIEELETIHKLKTGELIRFAIKTGAYLAGATPPQIEAVDRYGKCLGLLFQIQDDILDVIGDKNLTGKPIGSDEEKEKSTYPKLLGLEEAIQKKEAYMREAIQALSIANIENTILKDIVEYIGNRNH